MKILIPISKSKYYYPYLYYFDNSGKYNLNINRIEIHKTDPYLNKEFLVEKSHKVRDDIGSVIITYDGSSDYRD